MKLIIVLFAITAISLTGCYTQLVVQEDDDRYVYHEPQPIIILLPAPYPQPVPFPAPSHYPPKKPIQPIYKTRKPVTPPPNNDRIRDDIRNSGGRNDGGRKSRR